MAWYRCMGDNSTGLSTLVAKPYNVVNGNYSTNNNVVTYNIVPASGYEGMSIQLVNLDVDTEYLITFDVFLTGLISTLPNSYSWKVGIIDGTLTQYSGDYGNKNLYNGELYLPKTNNEKKSYSFYVKPQSSTTTLYFCTTDANSNLTLGIDNFKYVDKNDKKNEKIVYIGDMIPRMTSDTEPSGVASASYLYGSRKAYAGFHTYEYVGVWHDDEFWYNDSQTGQEYLQYEFEQLVSIKYIRLSCSVSGDDILKFQSSIDGINFTDICFVDVATADSMFEVDLGSFIAMKYFRILYLPTSVGYLQSIRAIGYKGNGPIPSAIEFKTYAKFNGYGLELPYTINADYKITVEFYQTTYSNNENIIGNIAGSSYVHLTPYSNSYYTSNGSSEDHFGTWSAGDHIFVCNNGNDHNEFDEVEVTSYTPTTNSTKLTIGKRNTANPCYSYIKHYKIESISTGDVICDIKPCLIGNIVHGLYDTINERFYYVEDLQVMDTIPTS